METDINDRGEVVCLYCRNKIYGTLNEEADHTDCKNVYGEWPADEKEVGEKMDAKEMLGKTLYEKIMKVAEEAIRDGVMKSLPENLQEMSSFVTFCRYKNRGDFSVVDENDVRVAASRVKTFGEKAFSVRRY